MLNKIKEVLLKVKDFIMLIGQFTWGAIQSLIGAIFLLIMKRMDKIISVINYKTVFYVKLKKDVLQGSGFGGVSLGGFIFLTDVWEDKEQQTLDHEYGHCMQSLLFGPLYLLVIGIPSVIWNVCFRKYRKEKNVDYYSFYTEKWADIWGKVNR